MRLKTWLTPLTCVAALTAALVVWRTASAGPPAICWPVEIGQAKSLPWGDDAFDTSGSYDVDNTVADTLDVLKPKTRVLVRMETLRRAALYLNHDEGASHELLASLMARALDSESQEQPDALAWFDAGYLVQTYHQLHRRSDSEFGMASDVAGYAWMKRAIELRGEDAEMQFAAAVMTALDARRLHDRHVEMAGEYAGKDPLLQKNLDQFQNLFDRFRGH